MTEYVQTALDVLRSGIEAATNIFGGAQSFAEAGNQAAAGTGALAEAFKIIYNVFAGLLGFDGLDPAAPGPEPDYVIQIIS